MRHAFTDLDQRLAADGIDPALARLPRCQACGQARRIVSYEDGRLGFGCRTLACRPETDRPDPRVGVVVALEVACATCDAATEHRLAELPNGTTMFVCGACATLTLLAAPVP